MSDYRMNLNEFLSGSLWTTDGWENFSQFVGAVCRFVHAMTLFQQLKKLLDGDSWIRRTSEREDLPHQNPERPSGRDTQNTNVQHCVPEDHLITKNHQMYVWNLYCTSLIWSICQMQITAVFLSNRATNPASLIVPSHPQNSHEECFVENKATWKSQFVMLWSLYSSDICWLLQRCDCMNLWMVDIFQSCSLSSVESHNDTYCPSQNKH